MEKKPFIVCWIWTTPGTGALHHQSALVHMTDAEAEALEAAMQRTVRPGVPGYLKSLEVSEWSLSHSFNSFIEEFDIKGPFPGLSKRWRA